MEHPIIGKTYRFNNAMAQVVSATGSYVTWIDAANRATKHHHLSQPKKHRTPRWYFDRYATVGAQ